MTPAKRSAEQALLPTHETPSKKRSPPVPPTPHRGESILNILPRAIPGIINASTGFFGQGQLLLLRHTRCFGLNGVPIVWSGWKSVDGEAVSILSPAGSPVKESAQHQYKPPQSSPLKPASPTKTVVSLSVELPQATPLHHNHSTSLHPEPSIYKTPQSSPFPSLASFEKESAPSPSPYRFTSSRFPFPPTLDTPVSTSQRFAPCETPNPKSAPSTPFNFAPPMSSTPVARRDPQSTPRRRQTKMMVPPPLSQSTVSQARFAASGRSNSIQGSATRGVRQNNPHRHMLQDRVGEGVRMCSKLLMFLFYLSVLQEEVKRRQRLQKAWVELKADGRFNSDFPDFVGLDDYKTRVRALEAAEIVGPDGEG